AELAANTAANAVPMTPAIGASSAAIGIVVGSVPVTRLGDMTLTSATATQSPPTTRANAAHGAGSSPPRRDTAASTSPEATLPGNQAVRAARGRWSLSAPVIMSGAKTEQAATAIHTTTTAIAANP